jgi:hypothetical protein
MGRQARVLCNRQGAVAAQQRDARASAGVPLASGAGIAAAALLATGTTRAWCSVGLC